MTDILDDDLLVVSKFRNLRMHHILKTKRVQDWAELADVTVGTIYEFAGLRRSPFSKKQEDALQPTFTLSAQKVAAAMNVDPEWLFPASLYSLNLPKTVERTYQSPQVLSLQQASAQHLLPETTESCDSHILNAELRAELRTTLDSVFEKLSKREVEVLKLLFGFEDGEGYPLPFVADKMGYSRTRTYQIMCKALRKLRHPSLSSKLRKLRGFTGDFNRKKAASLEIICKNLARMRDEHVVECQTKRDALRARRTAAEKRVKC